jgi:beta-barrel assembly-enhancing protease
MENQTTSLDRSWKRVLLFIAVAALLPAVGFAKPQQNQQASGQDEELQIGQAVWDELKAQGEIVENSPLYDKLRPIADAIARAAQPQYNHPFKFYLIHEKQPNAFAVPGGNVYVVDSLMYFAKDRDELAGVLCHEVSRTIHHDTITLIEKREKLIERQIAIAVLIGADRAQLLALALIGKLRSLGYSRDVESRADITGSDICASAGNNPWGLVWLFEDFKDANPNEVPQLLSDHPSDDSRVRALKQHFRENPQVFGRFNSDARSAIPLTVPKNAPESFYNSTESSQVDKVNRE